jgi:hypothetical protein
MDTDNILSAKHHATYLAERLLVAYYARDKHARDYHVEQAHESLRIVAEHMGYALAHLSKDDGLPSDWIPDDMHIYNVAS